MSNFRNVENDGIWEPGGTYTFEVYEPWTEGGEGSCELEGIPGFLNEGSGIYGDEDEPPPDDPPELLGNILFDNNNQNLDGGVTNTEYDDVEELEGDWWRYTITIPEDLEDGTYYLKHASWSYCAVL